MNNIKLTQYSHGAGCGCKISPQILDQILQHNLVTPDHKNLLVGNHSKDDAAVFDLGNGQALITTTDFFMPIVDDPCDFGRIAAANAISDIYAMGGKPVLAVAILGWPVNNIPANIAQKVVEGGRSICLEAGIPLAGGHSIDSPEPIFGLAVNGLIRIQNIKQNNTAQPGDWIYLTKPLGVGILTTAEKKGILLPAHQQLAARQMMQLNMIGEILGELTAVTSMTDVTGFGLAGHLYEMAAGSGCSAELFFNKIPLIAPDLGDYILQKAIPGGTQRNWDSYGKDIGAVTDFQKNILADPQTSGGLLFTAKNNYREKVEDILQTNGLKAFATPIGRITERQEKTINIIV